MRIIPKLKENKIVPNLDEINYTLVPPSQDSEGRDLDTQAKDLSSVITDEDDVDVSHQAITGESVKKKAKKINEDEISIGESRTLTKRDLRRMKYLSNRYLFHDLKEKKGDKFVGDKFDIAKNPKIKNLSKTVFDKEYLLKEVVDESDPYMEIFYNLNDDPKFRRGKGADDAIKRALNSGAPFTVDHIQALIDLYKQEEFRNKDWIGAVRGLLSNRILKWAHKPEYKNVIEMSPDFITKFNEFVNEVSTDDTGAHAVKRFDASAKGQTAAYKEKEGRKSDYQNSGFAPESEKQKKEGLDDLLKQGIEQLKATHEENEGMTKRIIEKLNYYKTSTKAASASQFLILAKDFVDPNLLLIYGALANNKGLVERAFELKGGERPSKYAQARDAKGRFGPKLRDRLLTNKYVTNPEIIDMLKINGIKENKDMAKNKAIYITEEQYRQYLNAVNENMFSDAVEKNTPNNKLAYKTMGTTDYDQELAKQRKPKAASSVTKDKMGYKYPTQFRKKTMSIDGGKKVNKSEFRNDYFVKEGKESKAILSKKELLALLDKK
jgi:hypothetical protein